MLAEELKWMLAKGWSAQYRHISYQERHDRPLYESQIARTKTHTQRKDNGMDLWGGGRNAELGAWNQEEEGVRAVGRGDAHGKTSSRPPKGVRPVE